MSEQQPELISNNTDIIVQSPSMLMQMAIQKDFDIERLKALLDLQERWERNEAKKAYVKAMTEFKKNPPQIIKDMHVEFTAGGHKVAYNHASLGNIVGVLTESLSKQDMSVNWQTNQADNNKVKVTCTVTHIAGYSEFTSIEAPPDTTGTKNSIQAIGSTITYLQRYTLLAICGLATNEFEDDGRQGNNKQLQSPKQQPKKQQPTNNGKDKNLIGKEIYIGNMLMALAEQNKEKATNLLQEITRSEDGKFKGIRTAKDIKSLKQANFIINDIKNRYNFYDWNEFAKTGELVDLPKQSEPLSMDNNGIDNKLEPEPPEDLDLPF